ncbi:uncharacterized protein LOC102900269 isoform X5 [Felis catus]|uniref:uncharacterized protein LOC102900269 isoform X5 n=1 Tax=Felis catus TaxID=9685 RepID=UPI001D19EF42|nr:uncharacterized protein LOC102900269 isoform X5 [Felis catus]
MGLCKSKLPHKGRALRSRRRGIITDLISNTMLSCQESWAFLTDGFPWKLKQAKELERIILAEAAPEDILPSAALSLKGCSDGRGWGLLLLPSSQRPHRAQKGCRACEATAAHQALELGPFPFTAQVSAWGDADRLGPSQAFTTSIKNEQTSASKLYRGREERKRRHPADTGRFCYHLFVKLKTSDKK